jgi:hypothetical protein
MLAYQGERFCESCCRVMDEYQALAAARSQVHDEAGRLTDQILPDRDLIGIIAEAEFAKMMGYEVNRDIIPSGDDGYDFVVARNGQKVDVKATTIPHGRLMVRCESKALADLYVLGIVNLDLYTATFPGWAWKRDVLAKGKEEEYRGTRFWTLRQSQLNRFFPGS